MTPEEVEIAKLAAHVSGTLNQVDSGMMDGPRANKINMNQFVRQQVQYPQAPQYQPQRQTFRNPNMVEQPIARPLPPEVVSIPIEPPQMITMDGLDEETRKAIARYEQQPSVAPIVPSNPSRPVNQIQPNRVINNIPPQSGDSVYVIDLLKSINEKLDFIMERCKITDKFRKVKKRNKDGQSI